MEKNKETIENNVVETVNKPKEKFIKIIYMILFLALIWGVVAGTDFILNFIKDLFF